MQLDGCAFPDAGWSDFVVIVLGWWIEETLQALTTKRTRFTMMFMDGPYEARFARPKADAGQLTVELVRRKRTGHEVIHAGALPLEQLENELMKAGIMVRDRALELGYLSPDLDLLVQRLSRLEELMGRPRHALGAPQRTGSH